MLNALPYVILVLFYGGIALCHHYIQDREKALFLDLFSIFVFIIFFGFRGFIFYDWSSYYPEFQHLVDFRTLFTLNITKWTWEPGFMILALFCKTIYPDYQFFVLVTCCLDTLLLVCFLRRYKINLGLGLMLYLCMGGLQLSTDLMRNSITILLFANALRFIEEKRPLPYFAICLLAVTIHSSSVVFFPMYFILNRTYNKWIVLAVFVVSNVIYVGHIPILKTIILLFVDILMPSTKLWIEEYLNMDAAPTAFLSIGYLERLLTGTLLFCYWNKLDSIRSSNKIFINCMILYLCTFLCLSEFRTISVRCSLIFTFAYWILWADFIKCFSIQNNKKLYIGFLVIYCVMKTVGNCHSEIASYYNVLFTNETYDSRLINFCRHFNDK